MIIQFDNREITVEDEIMQTDISDDDVISYMKIVKQGMEEHINEL